VCASLWALNKQYLTFLIFSFNLLSRLDNMKQTVGLSCIGRVFKQIIYPPPVFFFQFHPCFSDSTT
jgi:hypothetical protein